MTRLLDPLIVLTDGSHLGAAADTTADAANSATPPAHNVPANTIECLAQPVHPDALRLCLKVEQQRAPLLAVPRLEQENARLGRVNADLLWRHLVRARFNSIPNIDRQKVANESDEGVHLYTMDQFLGEGAFGNVRVGRRRATPTSAGGLAGGRGDRAESGGAEDKVGDKVAIKIINKDRVTDVDGLEMVDREVCACVLCVCLCMCCVLCCVVLCCVVLCCAVLLCSHMSC